MALELLFWLYKQSGNLGFEGKAIKQPATQTQETEVHVLTTRRPPSRKESKKQEVVGDVTLHL